MTGSSNTRIVRRALSALSALAAAWTLLAAACSLAEQPRGGQPQRRGPGPLDLAVGAWMVPSPPGGRAEGLSPPALGYHEASRLLNRAVAYAGGWLRSLQRQAAGLTGEARARIRAEASPVLARVRWRFGARLVAVRHGGPPTGGGTPGPGPPALPEDAAATTGAQPAVRPPPHRIKTPEELRVEQLIEKATQEYFRQYQIAGRTLTLRMPFGLNGEREGERGYAQVFRLGGKGSPAQLWPHIDAVLDSPPFRKYAEALLTPGDKVIEFDLRRRAYEVSHAPALLEALETGPYPGSPTRIYVKRSGGELLEADLYNYLYAVAAVGVDCSGFTHQVHRSITAAYGVDLDAVLAAKWRVKPRLVSTRIGLWFYDPGSGYTETVEDRIANLRPGDVLLFRGRDGAFKHSAVIQSIDLENGLLRYAQSTDWAPEEERGVHLSVARFDPARPGVSLGHYSVRWLQQVRPPFRGELEPADWLNDGDRYRWYPQAGGSQVVRLRTLAAILLERSAEFYTNLYGDLYGGAATSSSSWAAPSSPPQPAGPR